MPVTLDIARYLLDSRYSRPVSHWKDLKDPPVRDHFSESAKTLASIFYSTYFSEPLQQLTQQITRLQSSGSLLPAFITRLHLRTLAQTPHLSTLPQLEICAQQHQYEFSDV